MKQILYKTRAKEIMSLLRRIPIHLLLLVAILVTGFSAFLLSKVDDAEYILITVLLYGVLTALVAVRRLSSTREE